MDAWMDGWWMDDCPYYAPGWILIRYFWDFRVLSRTSSIRPSFRHRGDGPLGVLERENEDYPESIAMKSMGMANPYGDSVPGAPGNGYGKHLLRWRSYPGKKVKSVDLGEQLFNSSRKRRIGLSLPLQTPTLQRLNIEGLEKTSSIITCQSSLLRDYEKWECAHPVPAHWGYGEMWAQYDQILRFF